MAIAERLPSTEGASTFQAFSGTTVENFRLCAVRYDSGLVVFDKLRQPLHHSAAIYYIDGLRYAVPHARYVALKYNHTPLVIEGGLSERYKLINPLPVGMTFPVERVWIPKDDQLWRTMRGGNELQATDVYQEVDPFSFLEAAANN